MRKGFTLVELLIVLAVIAALMSVATPLALNAVKTAKASQVAQNFRNIKSAFENYFNMEKPSDPTTLSLNSLVPGYLSTAPNSYTLTVASAGSGAYTVTITYGGGDVDKQKVKDNYPDVNITGDNPVLSFTVQKWW
ncbi:type II secretion system protein [Fervidobacterium sp.]